MKVLTGGEVVKAETPITKVSLDVTRIDFGSFPQSEKQERKFTLTNTGPVSYTHLDVYKRQVLRKPMRLRQIHLLWLEKHL